MKPTSVLKCGFKGKYCSDENYFPTYWIFLFLLQGDFPVQWRRVEEYSFFSVCPLLFLSFEFLKIRGWL